MKTFKKLGGLVLVSVASFGLASCDGGGGQNANVNSSHPANANVVNTVSNTANTPSNASNAATNVNVANSNSNTVVVGDVKRISFAKGATSGTVNVNLPPGGAQQFAVEGTYGQKIKVTAGSKDALVKMISGTDRQVESPGGGLVVSINVAGDVIFEVKNASDKPLNTTVRTEITSAY